MSSPYFEADGVTLYHGDCREVLAWLAGDVMVTDPPYGMAYRSGRAATWDRPIASDQDTGARDTVLDLWDGRPALVFGRWSVPRPAATRAVLTWDKGPATGMGDLSLPWKPNTEEVYVLGSGFVGHRGSSVLAYQQHPGADTHNGKRLHPTEKPLALMRDLVAKCSPDAVIVDPFAGSGTTLRAAMDLGRRAIGVELEERYCRAAADRLAQTVLDLTPAR